MKGGSVVHLVVNLWLFLEVELCEPRARSPEKSSQIVCNKAVSGLRRPRVVFSGGWSDMNPLDLNNENPQLYLYSTS